MKNLGKGIGGAILTFAFVFGMSAATSTSVQAQYRTDGQYHRRDSNRDDNNRDWRRNRERRRDRDRDGVPDRYERNNGYGLP
jgi:hypothetical protein